jgi:HSP20 family protein
MDNTDEKFFEQLAGGNTNTEEPQEVELAKASTSPATSRRTAQPKITTFDEEESSENVWDNGEPEGTLTVDVYQTPDDIVVQSAVAGVKPDDIDVSATPDKLTIRGARHVERETDDKNYLYQECYWGRFAREIILPQEVDPESATVTFKNGILTIRLPKVIKRKTRKLKVKAE